MRDFIKSTALRPLSVWLKGNASLPHRFYKDEAWVRSKDWHFFVSVEEVHPLHTALSLRWQGLRSAIAETDRYLESAAALIDGLEGGSLDREEREIIKEQLGEPPPPCLPIYFISSKFEGAEALQYIGKTITKSRFAGGHSAALRLHDPKFRGHDFHLSRCAVWLLIEDDYVALEWLRPESVATEILRDVEANLINHFRPTLNSHLTRTLGSNGGLDIHIQNASGSKFLNDTFIWNMPLEPDSSS